jgi:hypothetical protein
MINQRIGRWTKKRYGYTSLGTTRINVFQRLPKRDMYVSSLPNFPDHIRDYDLVNMFPAIIFENDITVKSSPQVTNWVPKNEIGEWKFAGVVNKNIITNDVVLNGQKTELTMDLKGMGERTIFAMKYDGGEIKQGSHIWLAPPEYRKSGVFKNTGLPVMVLDVHNTTVDVSNKYPHLFRIGSYTPKYLIGTTERLYQSRYVGKALTDGVDGKPMRVLLGTPPIFKGYDDPP